MLFHNCFVPKRSERNESFYESLKNILARRKKVKTEIMVDGYSGFLLLDKDDKPKVALHIENEMRWDILMWE